MSGLSGLNVQTPQAAAVLAGVAALVGFIIGVHAGPFVEVDVITTPVGCSACGS